MIYIYINDICNDIIMIFSSENIVIYIIIENINPFHYVFYYLLWTNKAHRFHLNDFVIVWLWYRQQACHCGKMEAQRNKFLSSKKAKTVISTSRRHSVGCRNL